MITITKFGSSSIIDDKGNFKDEFFARFQELASDTQQHVVIVSGAMRFGRHHLRESYNARRGGAIGQGAITSHCGNLATHAKKHLAQFLVYEHDIIGKRLAYALSDTLHNDTICIVNGNNALLGDCGLNNDTIAATAACHLKELGHTIDRLTMYTDSGGFRDEHGCIIRHISQIDQHHKELCDIYRTKSNGGFHTKLDAAKRCMDAGVKMIVTDVRTRLSDIRCNRYEGTTFQSHAYEALKK